MYETLEDVSYTAIFKHKTLHGNSCDSCFMSLKIEQKKLKYIAAMKKQTPECFII